MLWPSVQEIQLNLQKEPLELVREFNKTIQYKIIHTKINEKLEMTILKYHLQYFQNIKCLGKNVVKYL